MRSVSLAAYAFLISVLCITPSTSTEIKVLTSGGFAPTLEKILPQFQKDTGIAVTTSRRPSQGSSPNTIAAQLRRGVEPDVVILSREGLNELIEEGRILPESDKDLAQTPLGVAVHVGSRRPDISTIEAFKKALLEAKAFNWSSTSGLFLKNEVFPKLGIADRVNEKAIEGLITSEDGRRSEIGIQPMSEISNVPGIDYIGLVPPEAQFNSVFSAAIVNGSTERMAAAGLIKHLQSEAAKATIRANGMSPTD
jgi:molybdate transport system substrate-binding protein